MKTVRSRITYANVISTIALFLVLGGATAFAGSLAAEEGGSRISARIRGTASVALPVTGTASTEYPIQNPLYNQLATEDNQWLASLQVSFDAACTKSKRVLGTLYADSDGEHLLNKSVAEVDIVGDTGKTGPETVTSEFFVTRSGSMDRVAPGTVTPHKFLLLLQPGICQNAAGAQVPGGVKVTGFKLDVIATH